MSYIFLRRPRVMCKIEVHEGTRHIDINIVILTNISLSDRSETIYYIQVIYEIIIQN